jgi:hypothetical protein
MSAGRDNVDTICWRTHPHQPDKVCLLPEGHLIVTGGIEEHLVREHGVSVWQTLNIGNHWQVHENLHSDVILGSVWVHEHVQDA